MACNRAPKGCLRVLCRNRCRATSAPTDILAWTLGTGFWLIAINSIAMIAFHYDKRMAQSGGRRIAERTLLVIALWLRLTA